MSNEVATLGSIQEKVQERIKAAFVDLIPEEMWRDMVNREIHEFTQKRLPNLVREEAEKRVRTMMGEELAKPEWTSTFWGPNGPHASEMVKKIIIEAAPDIVASAMGGMVQNIVLTMRNNGYFR